MFHIDVTMALILLRIRSCVFLATCMVILNSLANCKVIFTQEPQTDRDCYTTLSSGMLTVSFNETNEYIPLDNYKVVWKTSSGETIVDGTVLYIYQNREDRAKQDARWGATIRYNNRTVTYKMAVVAMDWLDETGGLFAHIVHVCSGREVAMSTGSAKFKIDQSCSGFHIPSPVRHPIRGELLMTPDVDETEILFMKQPVADKTCYTTASRGEMAVMFSVSDPTVSLDKYKIIWKTYSGTTYFNGSSILIFENRDDRLHQDARWTITMGYRKRTVTSSLEVDDIISMDDRGPLFAHIVDVCTGKEVAKSEKPAGFNVPKDCSDDEIPAADSPTQTAPTSTGTSTTQATSTTQSVPGRPSTAHSKNKEPRKENRVVMSHSDWNWQALLPAIFYAVLLVIIAKYVTPWP